MMKKKLTVLVIMMIVVTTMFTFSLGNVGYSQKPSTVSILDSMNVKNTSLTLGKPFYTEKFEFPKSQNLDTSNKGKSSTSSAYSFEGNGTLNNLQIFASGTGNEISRGDGTSFLSGRALFTSQNGTASYTFEAITNNTGQGVRTSLGSAFFDANATGNLQSLRSIVGVYESYIDSAEGKGIFAMWHIIDLLPK